MPKAKRGATKGGASGGGRSDGLAQTTAACAPVDWPAFRPTLPITELSFEPIISDKVIVIRNFWPRSLCRAYVEHLKTLPLTTTPGKPRRGEAVRVNDRFQIDDEAFARRLWNETGLREVVLGHDDAQGGGQSFW